jgi:heat shock protein HslJ
MVRLLLTFPLFLNACMGDETLTAYGAADQKWHLQSINEKAFSATAILTFPESGKVTGTAPCNNFFASQNAPYPWFEVGPIGATKRACPDLALEQEFFKALSSMTISEISGGTLILSNDAKERLIFKSR